LHALARTLSPIPRGTGTAAIDMIRPVHASAASAPNRGDSKMKWLTAYIPSSGRRPSLASSLVLRLTSLEHLDECVYRAHLGEFRMSVLTL